jgi:fumarylacetoacetase
MQTKHEIKCGLPVDEKSDFPIYNLPFGMYSTHTKSGRAGIAIGEYIVDLSELYKLNFFDIAQNVFETDGLNHFISLGLKTCSQVREKVQDLLAGESHFYKEFHANFLDKQSESKMHMPVRIGDYTDFYSSEEHASNVGKLFRPNADPLLPNWKHLPVAYHGRSSSVIISGEDIKRPKGQYLQGEEVVYGESKTLDFELELGFIVGKNSKLGEPVSTEYAEEHIFGVVLLNDWSARDIQRWEYQPLGPFLGKNFATSISPWIVTMDALKHFRAEAPRQKPEVLPYLKDDRKNFDIQLEVGIETKYKERATVTKNNSKLIYWTIAQQIAHHTVNGCNLQIGDLLATGTISGKERDEWGSLLEITYNGKEPVDIGIEKRTFIETGDTVIMKGHCEKGGIRVGFGEVRNTII